MFAVVFVLTTIAVSLLLADQVLFSSVCQSGIREDNTNYIYCARKSLSQVPAFSKNNVVYDELVLADNRITELSSDSFARIKVKKIFLNGNPLRRIDELAFAKLENHLEELWIDGDTTIAATNLLAKPLYSGGDGAEAGGLPKAIVNYLRNLNTLKIKGFMVGTLGDGVLKRLKRIDVLSLKFCSIERIEPFAFDGLANSLKELYLDGNLMQQVPTEALLSTHLKSLRILSLAQNNIKTIGVDSFGLLHNQLDFVGGSLKAITKIDLSYNGLKSIEPNAFAALKTSLDTLLMQNNEINSFNLKFLSQLRGLRELNLAFNIINVLPAETFINSASLEVLELQGNSIVFDGERSVFEGLSGLHRLNLARNGIRQLPQHMFRPAYNLKSLTLDKNPIENLGANTFDGLGMSLLNLSLQNTKLNTPDLASLRGFRSLERVKLSFNQLDELDLSVFDNAHATLISVDLRKNHLAHIHDSVGANVMQNLLELDLSSNNLCTIDSGLLKRMPKLKSLGLSQNPLYCDCRLRDLYEWTRQRFDKDTISFLQWECEVPTTEDGLKTRQFTSVSAGEFRCLNNSKCQRAGQPEYEAPTVATTTVTPPVVIKNVLLKSFGSTILVSWTLSSDLVNTDISGFKINVNRIDSNVPGDSFVADRTERQFKLEKLASNAKYSICVSIIQYQGYDKYCREVNTLIKANEPASATFSTRKLFVQSLDTTTLFTPVESSSSNLVNGPGIVSGIMITVLCLLIAFIVGLLVFIYFYVKRCRLNKKQCLANNSKSLMLSNGGSTAIMSSRRPNAAIAYTGAKLTSATHNLDARFEGPSCDSHRGEQPFSNSTKCELLGSSASSSPQSTSTISNPNFCSCIQTGNTLGRGFAVGDTSTVSSTLSSLNNNNKSMGKTPQLNLLGTTGRGNTNGCPAPSTDFVASSPTSFQHFVMHNPQQQSGAQPVTFSYIPYEVYNCFQNGTANANLLQQVPAATNQYVPQFVNNSTLAYDKLNKLMLSSVQLSEANQSDHVYCEIPSTLNRINRNVHQHHQHHLQHLQQQHYNPSLFNFNTQNSSMQQQQQQNLVNQTNLLISTSNTTSQTPNISNTNNKYSASII